MKYYSFNNEEKEFKNAGDAQLDVLETKKLGREVYLLPANATWEEPLPPKDNYAVVWNGSEWQYVEDYRGKEYYLATDNYDSHPQEAMKKLGPLPEGATLERPALTFDLAKTKALQELKWEFEGSLQNAKVNSSLGFPIDADKDAMNNIQNLYNLMNGTGTSMAVFRDAENNYQNVNIDEVQTMLLEIQRNEQVLRAKKQYVSGLIAQAKTIEQVQAIDIKLEFDKEVPVGISVPEYDKVTQSIKFSN